MREILSDVSRWLAAGETVALATVVQAQGSSPRPPGARMAITASGQICGSISGGCLEAAIVEEAQDIFAGEAAKRLRYDTVGPDSLEIGLACGGRVEVYLEPLSEMHHQLLRALEAEETVALATSLTGTGHLLAWQDGRRAGDLSLDTASEGPMSTPVAEIRSTPHGEVFFETFLPQPTVVIIGATETGRCLVRLCRLLGFRSHVIDGRAAFATAERFDEADELTVAWPKEALESLALGPQHYLVILSHDPKFDLPALRVALAGRAAYIGLLGSDATQAARRKALLEEGFTKDQLARIHGPVGLDLGGRQPVEIALAIVAEIVALRHGIGGRAAEAA